MRRRARTKPAAEGIDPSAVGSCAAQISEILARSSAPADLPSAAARAQGRAPCSAQIQMSSLFLPAMQQGGQDDNP